MAITLSQSRFLEPGRAGHLRLSRGVFVHFHTQAGAFGKSDVPLFDDFAFFDEVAPQVRRIDPMPLLHQEIGNRGAHVGAAIPNFLVQEWHWIDSPDLWRNFVKEGEIIEKGYIALPERAGLGVEMNEDAARKAQVPGTPWFEKA